MTIGVTRSAADAVVALRGGGLVAVPTETVYGLAALASDPAAVTRLFAVKGRPATHPVIVHLAGAGMLDQWATDVPPWARTLADALWPGPLTLIVPRSRMVPDAVTGGLETVGLRVPAHPLTLKVLRELGDGLAAPSANRYGQVSPTTAQHVLAELADRLDPDRDLVLDGGPCPVGVESTIIGAWDDTPRLLRAGAVTVSQVAALTSRDVSRAGAGVRAPGTTATHYAPRATVVPVEPDGFTNIVDTLPTPFGVIALAGVRGPDTEHVRLAAPADDNEYARVLYAALRAADDAHLGVIVAVLPPDTGVGHAVRDRLQRAAAARPVTT